MQHDEDAAQNMNENKRSIIKFYKSKVDSLIQKAYHGEGEFLGEKDHNARVNVAVAIYYVTYYNSNESKIKDIADVKSYEEFVNIYA